MSSGPLIGCSQSHLRLLDLLRKVASTDVEVLITGPTGVGKELYARFVHQSSPRQDARFVAINCGALPQDLFENELFGHVGGAFTGARPKSEGLVADAEHGTLFLDEVDSLSLSCQVKLLRFLQDKEYRRLGETRLRHANVRIVSATNIDLLQATQNGRFREDLFFRLRVFPVEVPPLCERPEDIPPLLDEFIAHYANSFSLPKITLSKPALQCLTTYAWPGNIRELKNCLKYLTCLQLTRPVSVGDLPLLEAPAQNKNGAETLSSSKLPLAEAKRELVTSFERKYLAMALVKSNGNIAHAARASGKPRRAFFELLRKHGISAARYRFETVASDQTDRG
jgi:DNA-binding NtrC family response regulator